MNPVPAALSLKEAQMAQQIDLSRRLLHMAMLGSPRIESDDPNVQELLALHALSTTYLALASATRGLAGSAASLAFDISHELQLVAEQQAAASH